MIRKTLIALAVGGIASVAFAKNNNTNMNVGWLGAPVGMVTGQTESGPIHSLIGQVAAPYPESQMYVQYVRGPIANAPAVTMSTPSTYQPMPVDGSTAVSRTWYMPDGSVIQEGSS